jgi:hypothetical protein
MPTCTAFTKQSKPCTAHIYTHERTLCRRHLHMMENPERFNREQAALRENWRRLEAGTHVRVGTRIVPVGTLPVAVPELPSPPPPVVRPTCIAFKQSGERCTKQAQHDDNHCNLHHAVALREQQRVMFHRARLEINRIYRTFSFSPRILAATFEEAMPRLSQDLTVQNQQRLQSEVYTHIVRPLWPVLRRLVEQGATFAQADAHVQAWVADGTIAMVLVPLLHDYIHREIVFAEWERARRQPMFGANQREAQLAADPQNVHTQEITQQMKDAVAMLSSIKVPSTQTNTLDEIQHTFLQQKRPLYDIRKVMNDVEVWWRKPTTYIRDDKLYKKCLRGLWWTIKQYKGEVREELEKRLWDELRDGAIPHSVCTQGHMARLSNVMVGFDEAFVPPVPVGEILQQKMAAIYGMDVPYDEQIRLANEVFDELKIPEAQHADWLAAF